MATRRFMGAAEPPDQSIRADFRTGTVPQWEALTDSRKVHLPKEKETYLSTLYGKAMDAPVEHPILGDQFAAGTENSNGMRLEIRGIRNATSLIVRFRREDS